MYFINVSGGGRQLHKVVYDPKSGQFGFVFDDERYKLLFQETQDPAVLEEVKKLKIKLDEANVKVQSCERENGATIMQAEVWKQKFGDAIAQAEVAKKGEMKAETETKEVLEKVTEVKKELAAERQAKKSAMKAEAGLKKQLEEETRARRQAEAVAVGCKAEVARLKQSTKDVKAAEGDAKNDLRQELTKCKQCVESLKVRANKAETRNKDLIIQVGEEKDLRAVVVQEKGELVDLLENAQRLREEAEEQLKIRMEELATQTEKLRRAEEGVAVDSGVPVCVTVYTQTDAVVVGPTSSDAVVESETEVMSRLDIQTVEFATQTEAATETSASGVERDYRHEVEGQTDVMGRPPIQKEEPEKQTATDGNWSRRDVFLP